MVVLEGFGASPVYHFVWVIKGRVFASEQPRSTRIEVSFFLVRGFPSDFRKRLVWGGWRAQTLDVEQFCHLAWHAAALAKCLAVDRSL